MDVLVSEPMGTLLVNERMIESFVYARDKFLKPGGKMYPVRCGQAFPVQRIPGPDPAAAARRNAQRRCLP